MILIQAVLQAAGKIRRQGPVRQPENHFAHLIANVQGLLDEVQREIDMVIVDIKIYSVYQAGDLQIDGIKSVVFILDQEGNILAGLQLQEIGQSFADHRPVLAGSKYFAFNKLPFQLKDFQELRGIYPFTNDREVAKTGIKAGGKT